MRSDVHDNCQWYMMKAEVVEMHESNAIDMLCSTATSLVWLVDARVPVPGVRTYRLGQSIESICCNRRFFRSLNVVAGGYYGKKNSNHLCTQVLEHVEHVNRLHKFTF